MKTCILVLEQYKFYIALHINIGCNCLQTPTDDIEVIHTERVEAPPETPPKDDSKSQEAAEVKSKGNEKPSKTNLRKFFKLVRTF